MYSGTVGAVQESYLFVNSSELKDSVFVHRTRVDEDKWSKLQRGTKVLFTVGFNMRGPTAQSIDIVN